MILAGTGVWLVGLSAYPLFESTEGRYASVAWSMAHGGSCIEPMFNGVPLFTKPPLAYWAGALCLGIFPDSEWAVRLPATVMLLLCAWLTSRLALTAGLDRRRAHWAGALAALSPLAFIQGHMTTGDIFLWAGVLLSFLCLFEETRPRIRRAALLGLGLAVGFMAKGHMVLFWVLIPAGVWVLTRHGEPGLLKLLVHPVTVLVFAGLTVPWFAVVLHRHPGLLDFWLRKETADRILSNVHGRGEPWWYFLPQVPALVLPWLAEFRRGLWGNRAGSNQRLFWLIWILVPLAIFTFSGSKRPNYLLPMVTPMVLFAACGLPEVSGRWLWWRTGVWTALVLISPFVIGFAHWAPPTRYLVAHTEAVGKSLVTYRTEPSSLVFYAGGRVPVFGLNRSGPVASLKPPPSKGISGLMEHLAAGGLVLLRRSDLSGLSDKTGMALIVHAERGKYLLVGGKPSEYETIPDQHHLPVHGPTREPGTGHADTRGDLPDGVVPTVPRDTVHSSAGRTPRLPLTG